MSESNSTKEDIEKGVSWLAAEIAVAVLLLILGFVVCYDNYRIGISWGSDGPESGYFPFRIGVFIILASVAIMAQALFSKKLRYRVFVTYSQLRLVLSVLVPTLLYVFGIELIGIYFASAIFIGLFMRLLGRYRWVKTVIVGLSVPILLFLMFEIWFKVPLPKGPIEAAFGF